MEENELKIFEEHLLTLDAEGVIYEHIKSQSENDIPKMKATFAERYRNADWVVGKVKCMEILEIALKEEETEKYLESFDGIDGNIIDAKVFDVMVEVKPKWTSRINVYTERYYMIKEGDEMPWLIESVGFS